MPTRLQLQQTKGYRKPEGAVVVARPGPWGNPYKIGAAHPEHGRPMSRQETVDLYRKLWEGDEPIAAAARSHIRTCLRGRDLACWCSLDASCHADVLLEIANAEPVRFRGGADWLRFYDHA